MESSYGRLRWVAVESRFESFEWYVELSGNCTTIWILASIIDFNSFLNTCFDCTV